MAPGSGKSSINDDVSYRLMQSNAIWICLICPPLRYWFRFVLLFSYIIPISLRVNLEMGRVVYSYMIQRDIEIPGTVVRTTTIPEDLGRISYLLTDKTGTLTRNEMVFKRIHLGKVSYTHEYFHEVAAILKAAYTATAPGQQPLGHRRDGSTASTATVKHFSGYTRGHMRVDSYDIDRDTIYRVHNAVLALALCHNVTPSESDADSLEAGAIAEGQDPLMKPHPPLSSKLSTTSTTSLPASYHHGGHSRQDSTVTIQMQQRSIQYQASSPDEVALVQWTERVGVALTYRDITSMTLRAPNGQFLEYDILQIFPFSSETKRMGIIVRERSSGEITFYLKGADTVMASIIQYSDWLQEQCDNMARSGLRTLVVAKKILSADQYSEFEQRYNQAKCSMDRRNELIRNVIATLEKDLELLCLTGIFMLTI